jgi:hypothetical protein
MDSLVILDGHDSAQVWQLLQPLVFETSACWNCMKQYDETQQNGRLTFLTMGIEILLAIAIFCHFLLSS